MFAFFKNKLINFGMGTFREWLMGEYLDGIGVIRELTWKDGVLHLEIILNGLEDRPIDVSARDIEIAPDASAITIRSFESNMPFAQTALSRYATRTFAVPEGKGRSAVKALAKALGI